MDNKKPKSKSKPPAKAAKRPQKLATKKISHLKGFLVKKDGTLETKEERETRLAKREALTLIAFRMAYDNYHNQ